MKMLYSSQKSSYEIPSPEKLSPADFAYKYWTTGAVAAGKDRAVVERICTEVFLFLFLFFIN